MDIQLPDGILLKGTIDSPRGRSIIAARCFKAGEEIATFASPSIAIPASPNLSTTCSGCLKASFPGATWQKQLRACSGCQSVCYCSQACQKVDWKQGGHKAECQVFKRLKTEGHGPFPTPVRALVQVLLRPEILGVMRNLMGHIDKFREDKTASLDSDLQAAAALKYTDCATIPKAMEQATMILCKLHVNSFNRQDQDSGQTGLFMNPALSMVNHSCIPNAFVEFIGRKAILRAYQGIKRDEAIEISYVDLGLPPIARQQALKTRYLFECDCPRCKHDMDMYMVCFQYPNILVNTFSLAPKLLDNTVEHLSREPSENKVLSAKAEEIYPWCSKPLPDLCDFEKMTELRRRWAACEMFRRPPGPVVIIDPVSNVLQVANEFLCEKGQFSYSLCITCFLAINYDPFKCPAPFGQLRLKGMLTILKLIAGGPIDLRLQPDGQMALSSPTDVQKKVAAILSKVDRLIMGQIMVEMILHYATLAHSTEWDVCLQAKKMWDEIEALRETRPVEHRLVKRFIHDPARGAGKELFARMVLKPIWALSELGLEVMNEVFGS